MSAALEAISWHVFHHMQAVLEGRSPPPGGGVANPGAGLDRKGEPPG